MSLAAIKPIPTTYAGVEFRSRLEARWALFFDAIGMRWLYEYEGYQLPSGWYLPDFWLPDIATHVEIKPRLPTVEEAEKCAELAVTTEHRTILMAGEVGWWLRDLYSGTGEGMMFSADGGGDQPYVPCHCHACGRAGFEFDGRGARVCINQGCGAGSDDYKHYSSDSERIIVAVGLANKHRFSYGRR